MIECTVLYCVHVDVEVVALFRCKVRMKKEEKKDKDAEYFVESNKAGHRCHQSVLSITHWAPSTFFSFEEGI